MKKLFKTTLASVLLMASAFASAVTIKDAKGEFTLDKTPSVAVFAWHFRGIVEFIKTLR